MSGWRALIALRGRVFAKHSRLEGLLESCIAAVSGPANSSRCLLYAGFSASADGSDISSKIESLGISHESWKSKCRAWGLRGLAGNLDGNLEVLEEWGMEIETRRSAVLGTPLMLNIKPIELEKKLLWMVDEMGFTREEVGQLVEAWPQLLAMYPEEDIVPFIRIFTREGCSQRDVKGMILRHPPVLAAKDTVITYKRFFDAYFNLALGMFLKMAIRCPKILSMKLASVRPAVEGVMKHGFDRKEVIPMIRKAPEILIQSLESGIGGKIFEYIKIGLERKQVMLMLKEAPDLLWLDYTVDVHPKVSFFVDELDFGWGQMLATLQKWPWMFTWPLEQLKETRGWFVMMGLGSGGIKELCQKHPQILSIRASQLTSSFAFARDVLGKEKNEIFQSPSYLTCSLERRVLLRVAWLDRRGEDYRRFPLKTLVKDSRKDFDEQYGSEQMKDFADNFNEMTLQEKLHAIKTSTYP